MESELLIVNVKDPAIASFKPTNRVVLWAEPLFVKVVERSVVDRQFRDGAFKISFSVFLQEITILRSKKSDNVSRINCPFMWIKRLIYVHIVRRLWAYI